VVVVVKVGDNVWDLYAVRAGAIVCLICGVGLGEFAGKTPIVRGQGEQGERASLLPRVCTSCVECSNPKESFS